MTWDNYGSYWEIDHIEPESWFRNENPEEYVKIVWALENLQPQTIFKNRSKGNKFKG